MLSSFRKKKRIMWANPGPHDLTTDKVKAYMDRIRIGDVIEFYSIAECFRLDQVDRHNTKIRAFGEVVSIPTHRRFVVVKLRRDIMETVDYFSIKEVNGVPNPGFLKGGDCIDATKAAPGRIVWE